MRLSDFKGVFKKENLEFMSAENVFADYWVIKLKHTEGLTWRPGEHGIFTMPGKKIKGKKWRAFSIASIPGDGYIRIGTRTGKEASIFKRHLTTLKQGEPVSMRGPFGWFVLKDDLKPLVLIAGGVGITPAVALLRQMDRNGMRAATLIHSSGERHLFRDEIEKIAAGKKNLKLVYTATADETKVKMLEAAGGYGSEAYYYISGSVRMMMSVRKRLKKAGVKGGSLISDPFLGY